MIKVNADVNNKFLTLDAVRMDNDDWVFGCKETRIYKNTRVCDEGDNLSGDSAIIPSRGKRKSIQLDMHKLKENRGYSHIVVHTPVHTEDTKVSIDLYDPRERQKTYTVPKWITFWRSYPIIEKTLPGAVYYNISLVSIDHPWQAYDIHVNPVQCAYEDPTKVHYGLARFYTPWANTTTQVLIGQGINFTNTLTAKLMSSKTSAVPADLHPQVHLYLDPACSYSVHIQASLPQMMGQLVRYYAPLILPFSSCILILILAFQMRRFETEKYCKSSLLILMAYVR
ncbi:GPI inositol-deacylase [Eurytemora carolleeae]|uniref:GPI inositol-deacylase n=1 Tax=Eurytemora carolleeae TaxID=1294199 RepID=UPI000C790AF3|nr:GPI inositol-deacylase [Eurytemora carolleeae]|eukprot:XP_023347047.1 GPI inositol-deacylase-like [Eurytemora affinis]